MVAVLWIVAVVVCCALCGWGIATAARRSRQRRYTAVRPRAHGRLSGPHE